MAACTAVNDAEEPLEVGEKIVEIATPLRSAVISPDGGMIAICSDTSWIDIYSVETGTLIRRLEEHRDNRFARARFTSDGSAMLGIGRDAADGLGMIVMFQLEDGSVGYHLNEPDLASDLAISPDDGIFVTVGSENNRLRFRDLARGREFDKATTSVDAATKIEFSIGGNRLLVASQHDVSVVDLVNKSFLPVPIPIEPLADVSFIDDGVRVAGTGWKAGSSDGFSFLSVMGTDGQKYVDLFNPVAEGDSHYQLDALAMGVPGEYFAVSANDGTIRIIRVADGRTLGRITGLNGRAFGMQFSSDGKILLAHTHETVQVWRVQI